MKTKKILLSIIISISSLSASDNFIDMFQNKKKIKVKKYIKQTPMAKQFSNVYGKNVTPYDIYSSYFLKNKISNNKEAFKRIINSKDKYLKYYEAIIKSLYYYYKERDTNKALKIAYKVYDRGNAKLINTMEGLFMQDLFLSSGKIKLAKELIPSDISYCDTIKEKNIKIGCIANNISLNCLGGKEYYSSISTLKSLNVEIAKYSLKYCIIK